MNIFYTLLIYPITQIIEFIFVFAQNLFKETGLSIISVSAAVNILCLPLYMVAENWHETERAIQKKLAGKTAKIHAVFKGDERHMILSTYYRQNHYHPVFAMRSSFGLLIQIPFFIAAYSYLSQLKALQGMPFLFIKDLGKPDMLLSIFGGVNLLPILMTLINCVSGAVYTKGFAAKDKIQLYGMAVLFLVLLYNSPSGLVLYWTLNNVFSLLKNAYLKLNLKNKHFMLLGIISFSALLLSYYTLFIFHGNIRVRILITTLSLSIGILSWLIPMLSHSVKSLIKTWRVSWSSKETFLLFIFSIAILWVTTGLFLPSMLISASPQEFSFLDDVSSPLTFIFNTAVQSFGLFIIWPLMIYFLFSGKVKKVFSILAAIISFSALCNVFVFFGNYGLISSELVFDRTVSHNLQEIAVNTLVLTIVFAILFFIYARGKKIVFSFLLITVFIALSSLSVKLLYSINSEFQIFSEFHTKRQNTDEAIHPIFQFSKTDKNILVIMLDKAESVFLPYIFEENPELCQKYEGFIYYPNTVSFNGWTEGGAPPIFGGYEYTPQGINSRPGVSLKEKTNEALLLMPKLFSASNFSVTITDPPYAGGSWTPDLRIYDGLLNLEAHITDGAYTDRWLKKNNIDLPKQSETLKRNILWYAVFREIPLAFRPGIYYMGSWCAPVSESRMRLFLNGYAVLDYLNELTDFEPKKNRSAIFMVSNAAHERLFLQAPNYRPQLFVTDYGRSLFSKEEWYHVNAAAMMRLSDYFDFLKSHNVYDNTRIILVSDHGVLDNSFVTKTGLPFHVDQFNPLLLIKDFNAKGEIQTDMTFMSTADVPGLAMKDLIENPVNPFTGNKITSDSKDDSLLVLIQRVEQKNNSEIELGPQNTYYVSDNIFDEKNWSRTDKIP